MFHLDFKPLNHNKMIKVILLLPIILIFTLNVDAQYIPQCVSFTPSSDNSPTGTAYFHQSPFFKPDPNNPDKYEFIWTQMNAPVNTWTTNQRDASNLASGQYKVEVWDRTANPKTVHYTIVTIPNSTMYQGYVYLVNSAWTANFYSWQEITPLNYNQSPYCLGKVRLSNTYPVNGYYHANTSIVNYSQVTILSTSGHGQYAIAAPTVISQTDSVLDSLCSGQYLIDIYNQGMQPEHFYVYIDQLSVSEILASIDEIIIEKKIVKITDVTGRQIEPTPNRFLFYTYSDGTIEKKLILEEN